MATAPLDTAIRRLRRTLLLHDGAGRTDGQLLASFIDQKDDVAFEALVRRHGRMVLSVCHRVVRNHHDAEDAFQATFLVLARKASSIRPRGMVANWLHGVAYRTALKARTMIVKRQGREKQVKEMPEPEGTPQDPWSDLQALLDQELNGLPEIYRLPILLCDLEGKSIKEATGQLGWPQGTLAGRLARGRKMLAKRLAGRGVAPSAGSLAAVVSRHVASACVPTSLMNSTVRAAVLIAAGKAAVAGMVPVKAAALMEGVMKAMLITKLKTVTAALLVVAAVGIGGGLCSRSTTAAAQTAPDLDVKGSTDAKTTGPEYNSIFIKTLEVMGEHFEEITYANRYDGRIEARTYGVAAAGMFRQAYVSLSYQDGKCFIAVRINKVKTTGDKSEVVGRDAELERAIQKEINAQQAQETQGKRFRGAGAEVVLNERNFNTGLSVSVNPDFGLHGSVAQPDTGTSSVAQPDTAKTDLDRLQGVWSVVSIERGGKPSKLDKAVFMVDGKRACLQTSDSEIQGGLYLEQTSKPKTYDLAMSTRTVEGIYSLEGDTLRLCYDSGAESKRPGGFLTEKGSSQILLVLKRTHGPEVFPYRLPDGTRAFPTLIERAKTEQTPPSPAYMGKPLER